MKVTHTVNDTKAVCAITAHLTGRHLRLTRRGDAYIRAMRDALDAVTDPDSAEPVGVIADGALSIGPLAVEPENADEASLMAAFIAAPGERYRVTANDNAIEIEVRGVPATAPVEATVSEPPPKKKGKP